MFQGLCSLSPGRDCESVEGDRGNAKRFCGMTQVRVILKLGPEYKDYPISSSNHHSQTITAPHLKQTKCNDVKASRSSASWPTGTGQSIITTAPEEQHP